jgi:hypothetical protein
MLFNFGIIGSSLEGDNRIHPPVKELSQLFEERIERQVWHECHRHTLGVDEYDCGHFFLVV